MKATNITLENYRFKLLVYGGSGTGKTHFLRGWPKCYVFDCDHGALTLRGARDENGVPLEYDPISNIGDFEAQIQAKVSSGEFETVCIDSITTLETMKLNSLVSLSSHPEATLAEYKTIVNWFKRLFQWLSSQGVHIICTAHEELVLDEVTGSVVVRPLIVGRKLPNRVPIYFDEVYRFGVKEKEGETEYFMATKPGYNFTAKSRIGAFAEREVPDFKVLRDKLLAATEEESAKDEG